MDRCSLACGSGLKSQAAFSHKRKGTKMGDKDFDREISSVGRESLKLNRRTLSSEQPQLVRLCLGPCPPALMLSGTEVVSATTQRGGSRGPGWSSGDAPRAGLQCQLGFVEVCPAAPGPSARRASRWRRRTPESGPGGSLRWSTTPSTLPSTPTCCTRILGQRRSEATIPRGSSPTAAYQRRGTSAVSLSPRRTQVRITFRNKLSGSHPLPIDHTIMGTIMGADQARQPRGRAPARRVGALDQRRRPLRLVGPNGSTGGASVNNLVLNPTAAQ